MDCKPGPATIFSKEEEDKICEYLVTMADIGYGLTREMVMRLAYILAERLHKEHTSKVKKLVAGGLMVLEAVTLNLPSVVYNHYLTAEPFVPIVTYYPLFLEKLVKYMEVEPPNKAHADFQL